MIETIYKSYDELPIYLSAKMVAQVLGVSISSAYELMHRKGFPSVRIGNRIIVPKDYLKAWMDRQIENRGGKR